MDVTALHSVTEDLAGYMSELTVSDLGRPTHKESVDVGTLILSLLEQQRKISVRVVGETNHSLPLSPTLSREALIMSANLYGGGFESEYRSSARILEAAFESVDDPRVLVRFPGNPGVYEIADLIEMQIRDTIICTWDIVQALGIEDYAPDLEVANQMFQYIKSRPEEKDNLILGKILERSAR